MKKFIAIAVTLLLLSGCSNGGGNNSNNPSKKANPFGDKVYSKEEVESQLGKGLSSDWKDYQINAALMYRESMPDNVLESFKNAVGEYRYDNIPELRQEWRTDTETNEYGDLLHALFDLYGVTPESLLNSTKVTADQLDKLVENNPRIDVSQYKKYEDGDAFYNWGASKGFEVLAENDLIKVEGPGDLYVNYYEDIGRYARITNISDHPVYINYYYVDKADDSKNIDWSSMEGYEAEYDKSRILLEDSTVLYVGGKDVLMPGEKTRFGFNYNKHQNFNTHWYLKVYEITEEEAENWGHVSFNQSIDYEVKTGKRKGEDVCIIRKNRTIEDVEFEYATIKGTVYNTDGEPLAYMPFVLTYVDVESNRIGNSVEEKQYITNYDGTFEFRLPVVLYETDNTYARYIVFVNGEKAMIDGRFANVVIDDRYCLEDEWQDEPYSEAVKRSGRRYGQKTFIGQISEAKEYECTIVVPDAYEYLVYDLAKEEDYGGQANYYDYGNGVLATVKFHDDEKDSNRTAYLNVFDTDGNLIFRKHLGVQACPIDVSDDGQFIATAITPANRITEHTLAYNDDYAPDAAIATIFDINGNAVFEYDADSTNRGYRMSHDNKLFAMEVESGWFGIVDIATKEVLWKDYRGNQVRQIIFSEDNSVVYMASEERVVAYKVSDGTRLWDTMVFHFPIDMVDSSKYLYISGKNTGGNDNKLACVDKETGKMVWTYQTGSRATKLTVSPDETLLFWSNDTGARDLGSLMLDAQTGEPLWTAGGGNNQAAWFTSDSRYVATKGYGLVEVFDRNGNKVATSAVGSNSRMSWFVYIKDDLSTLLDVAGGGGEGNSGWLYTLKLKDGYDREFIDKQWEARQ